MNQQSVQGHSGVRNYNFRNQRPTRHKRIKDYDFRKPKKFTKEHLRDLNAVNENIIRIFSSNLSSMLRVFCEITIDKVEEYHYSEYTNALPDKTLMGIIDLKAKGTGFESCPIVMYIPSDVNFFMIDILLGGSGQGFAYKRGYTEVEIEILKNFYEKLTEYLEESWNRLLECTCTLSSYETNPKLVQAISQDDSVIVLQFRLRMREIDNIFSICMPSINLDEVLHIKNQKYYRSHFNNESEKASERRKLIYNSLQDSTVELTAVLDEVMLDMHDVVNLQVSDVIPLNKKIDSDIIVNVDGMPRFTAKLGERKIKKAVKICGIAQPNATDNY